MGQTDGPTDGTIAALATASHTVSGGGIKRRLLCIITSPPREVRSIVTEEYVCLFVCLSARITRKPHSRTSPNFYACTGCSKKRTPLVYFDDNFGKYGPILTIIFSLLQQELYEAQKLSYFSHLTFIMLPLYLVKQTLMLVSMQIFLDHASKQISMYSSG